MKFASYVQPLVCLALLFGCSSAAAQKYGYKVNEYETYDTDDSTLADYVFPGDRETSAEPADLPSLAATVRRGDGSLQSLSVSVGKPFTIMQATEGHVIIHPYLSHWGDGKLLLRVSPDMDISDSEEFVLSSSDEGKTWEGMSDWPFGDDRGRHFQQRHVQLPDGRSLVTSTRFMSTERENEYILPAYLSDKEGKSFTRIDPVPFPLNWGRALDYQDPAERAGQRRGGPRNFMPNFLTAPGKPSQLMQDYRAAYGKFWLTGYIAQLFPLDDKTLLAFVAVNTMPRGERGKNNVICLESLDRGRSWALRSVPGPFDPVLDEKNRRKKPLDGFCEPSVTRLKNGNHLIVMRIGAWQRLYSAVSTDECRTWSRPTEISVFGILPKVITLPDGTLALCTGRPDNTLSFSFDNGESWPWTLRLLDQTNPRHPSTRNNDMIQVSPGRLLYVYDYGYRRPDPGVNVPHAIEGVFVDVSMAP